MKIFVALTLFLFSVSKGQAIDIEKLKKDQDLILYKAVSKEIAAGVASGRYNIPKEAITQARKRGGENLQKLLEDAGMKNAGEYVGKLTLQTTSMKKFMKKHSEIMSLQQNDRLELIKKLLK